MVDPSGLLMIEPSSRVSSAPIVDALTRKMTAAWRERRLADSTNGPHQCACGARSDINWWRVGGEPGWPTNSLCIHYLAYHRDEVPAEELEKVRALNTDGVEPTPEELRPPPPKRAERLARMPHDLRDWLAGIRTRGSQRETALDAFLNNGAVRMDIDPSRLPVPAGELEHACQQLVDVWDPPEDMVNTIWVRVDQQGSAAVLVRIQVHPKLRRNE